jgi:glucose uptake protein GlcU
MAFEITPFEGTTLSATLLGTTTTDATTGAITRTFHLDAIPMGASWMLGAYMQANAMNSRLAARGDAPVSMTLTQKIIPLRIGK